jgi:hypothetical protein
LQSFAELIHAFLAIAKAVEDPNSDRMCEGLEKLGFEVGDLLWHLIPLYIYTLICEYSHVKQVYSLLRELAWPYHCGWRGGYTRTAKKRFTTDDRAAGNGR